MIFTQKLITKIAARETDPINKARVLMSVYLVLAYLVFGLILMAAYTYTGQIPQLIRATLYYHFLYWIFIMVVLF